MSESTWMTPLETARLLLKYEKLVSPKYGVIQRVVEYPIYAGAPPLFTTVAYLTPPEKHGTGASFQRDAALISALGEAIERYSAKWHQQVPIIRNKSFEQITQTGCHTAHPERFQMFADFQYSQNGFALPRLEDASATDWVRGFEVDSGKEIFIPAAATFFEYPHSPHLTSNGLASGETHQQAILTGLYEMVESDFFMFAWWTQTSLEEVAWSSIPHDGIRWLLDKLGTFRQRIRVFSLPMDHGIPVYVAAIRGRNSRRQSAFSIGAAARLDPVVAIIKAVTESVQCDNQLTTQYDQFFGRPVSTDFDQSILHFEDARALYMKDEWASRADFLFNGSAQAAPLPTQDGLKLPVDHELKMVTQRLVKIGAFPVATDLTTRDVAAAGFKVYRVLVPELLQMNSQHRYRHWGQRRLFELKQKLGLSSRRLTIDDLNPLPHPFP